MMQTTRTYTNPAGLDFEIVVVTAPVAAGADFWGYNIGVTEKASQRQKGFRAQIKHLLIPLEANADVFVLTDPLTELKQAYLDQWDPADGSTPQYFPSFSSRGWLIGVSPP